MPFLSNPSSPHKLSARIAQTLGLVPVLGSVAEALSDSDGAVALRLEVVDHLLNQRNNSLLVYIVREDNVAVSRGVGAELVVELLSRDVRGLGGIVFIILGIEAGVDDVVAQAGHIAQARGVAGQERRAHVLGGEAGDAASSILELGHLGDAVRRGEGAQVWVGVGVGADKVALGLHAANVVRTGCRLDVAPVVAVDEEGGLDVVGGERIEELGGVGEGAIVKGEGDDAVLCAL